MSEDAAVTDTKSLTKAALARRRPGVPSWRIQDLCRDLAAGEVPRADLARKYGITSGAVTQFAKRHEDRIAEIRGALDQEFAGLWIARKAERVAAAQADYEMSLEGSHSDYFEQIRTRDAIRKSVAEELGQLPPRAQVMVMPVVHVIEAGGEIDVRRDLT